MGWRSIFWFLVICSGVWLLIIAVSLPETLRTLVGDGAVAVSGVHAVPLRCMKPRPGGGLELSQEVPVSTHSALRGFVTILCQKDKALVMSAIAILYMVWNCLQASLSTLFIEVYHFTYLEAGLIYIPFGVGVGCAGFVTGILGSSASMSAQTN
jgi:MFS family permease